MAVRKLETGTTIMFKQMLDDDLVREYRAAQKRAKAIGMELDTRSDHEKIMRADLAKFKQMEEELAQEKTISAAQNVALNSTLQASVLEVRAQAIGNAAEDMLK